MNNERTVTLTEKELVTALAEATANHLKDLMEAAESSGNAGAAVGASLAAMITGAAISKEATAILFPPVEDDAEPKEDGEQ